MRQTSTPFSSCSFCPQLVSQDAGQALFGTWTTKVLAHQHAGHVELLAFILRPPSHRDRIMLSYVVLQSYRILQSYRYFAPVFLHLFARLHLAAFPNCRLCFGCSCSWHCSRRQACSQMNEDAGIRNLNSNINNHICWTFSTSKIPTRTMGVVVQTTMRAKTSMLGS